MKLQNLCETSAEVRSVSLKKQYKGIRPLGGLVSIKCDDLDVASSSVNCWALYPGTEGQGKGYLKPPANS